MKPYYDDGQVTLYHGDCREILPALGPVDMVLVDPPYGDTPLEWDVPGQVWLPSVAPLLKSSGSLWCFGSLRMFIGSADFTGWHFCQDVIWEKHNGSGFHADRFKRVHEQIAQFTPAGRPWTGVYKQPVTTPDATARVIRRQQVTPHTSPNAPSNYAVAEGGPRLMRSVIYVRSCHGYAIHPAQKPVGILTPLIEYSCPPGGTVLDPFAGSASALEAARLMGRKAIGIELDERYCEAAARRLSQQTLNLEVA